MKRHIVTLASLFATAGASAADLADAIMNGNRAIALELIAEGADLDEAQGDGTTPLHWAVYKIDRALVERLLERGANPDVQNAFGSSPLGEAVNIADVELVGRLLEAGADPESPNSDGQTVLMLAARSGSLEIARLLVEHGADVNAKETWRGQTALMWAADARHPEVAKFLIARGANVSLRAMANDWPSQITSEPRAQYRPTGGLTPLLYAARSGCLECARAMLDAGADPNRPNPDGVTPLIVAIDNFAYDTAKLLLERGANPHVWDWWSRTALYAAVNMNTFRQRYGPPPPNNEATALDIVRMLLEAGVNPNAQLNMHRPGRGGNSSRFTDDLLTTGATPLLRAAIGHDVEAIELLLEHGALVDLPNVMGVTPLMAGAGVGVSPRDSRLNYAGRLDYSGDVQDRAIAAIERLLAAGADIDKRITDIDSKTARIARPSTLTERLGQTALYGAVKWGWERVVTYLVEQGAEVDIVDALGKSPIDAALGDIGGRDNTVSPEIAEFLRAASESG